jgi:ABC-2 type transport system permease protein
MKIKFANVMEIARKELAVFFSSLSAFVFLGVFLLVTHFIFFWMEPFFARNIADVRTLFDWMPVLLIFLVPALTMRMWSEERRAGTIEYLLTVSASNLELVLGKFVGCLALVAIALALTLPIPITVAFLGQLDWGPVFGGYLGALCLASAYAAIGLYVSTKSDNQIVSLLLSVLICSIFLLIGSDTVAGLFGGDLAEYLRLLSFSSRFESIARGVIDLGDLYYYLSVSAAFLALNVLSVEELRWAGNRSNSRHLAWISITFLAIANFMAANFWLQPLANLRLDITDGHLYSISPATKTYLTQLKEPLLIRGYFSKKTHPYLAPLVPRLRDLLKEYAVAGGGKVRV